MAYYTGTINSATPAATYMAAIDPQMISAGLTFVETYTSGTDVTNIYKSPGASNSLGIDYFIFINRPSTAGRVTFSISELYDVGTHLASKFAPYGLPTTANADYSVSGTCLPSSTTPGASLSKTGGQGFIPSNTAYTYYLNVNFERCIFGFTNPTGNLHSAMVGMSYVGIYEPVFDSLASHPTLCTLTLIGNNDNNGTNLSTHQASATCAGAVTRDYGVATTVSSTTVAPLTAWLASNYTFTLSTTTTCAGIIDLGSQAAYSNNLPQTNRLNLTLQRGVGNAYTTKTTTASGILKDVISNTRGSGLSGIGGDTLSVTNFAGTVLNYVKCGSPGTQGGMYWFPVQ